MPGDVTQLLLAHRSGHPTALKRVIELVYQEVLGIAHQQRRRHQAMHRTSSLAHAALERLLVEAPVDWQSRGHFFALLARTMRRVMVDEIRSRNAAKRGGGEAPSELDPEQVGSPVDVELVVVVNDALERMEAFHQRMAKVVECRVFGGLTEDETAAALDLPLRTVQRDWQRGRAWLKLALG
jgi:RNA polymerase sigma factor (TIGR02999 family)